MTALVLLFELACSAVPRARLPLEFEGDAGWRPRPTFLSNATDRPEIVAGDGRVMLRVAQPGKGMKFELAVRPFATAAGGYLLARYKAENLAGGYAFWVYDASSGGRMILSTRELVQDGQWHVVAVDLAAAAVIGPVRALLTEVQCRTKPASIAFDSIRLADEVPPGAHVVPKTLPKPVEQTLRPATLELQAEPTWLAKPAAKYGAERVDGVLHLWAEGHERGMKFSAKLPEPVDLAKVAFVAVRYRAQHVARWGDYMVWFGSAPGGRPPEYLSPIPLRAIRATGTWQVAIAPVTKRFRATSIALQVGSAAKRGDLWLEAITFSSRRPLIDVADTTVMAAGWEASRLASGTFAVVDLAGSANGHSRARLRALGLKTWFPAGRITAHGIPFQVRGEAPDIVCTASDIDETTPITLDSRASEVYVLMFATLPHLPPRHGQPSQPLRAFDNPERFVFRVEYADGVVDEMIPICLETARFEVQAGAGVYCLTGLRPVTVRRIGLRNRMEGGALLLAAMTLVRGKAATPEPHVTGLPAPCPPRDEKPGRASLGRIAGGYAIENDLVRLELRTDGGIALGRIENRCLTGLATRIEPGPLFEIGIGDKRLTSEQVVVGKVTLRRTGERTTLHVPVDGTAGGVPLRGELVVTCGGGPDILMKLDLVNAGAAVCTPVVNFPTIKRLRIGPVDDTWYLYGRKGGIVNNLPTSQRKAYGGEHPLQVTDVFNPTAGGGLALLTYDLDDVYRFWNFSKDEHGVSWAMEYWPREYKPGEKIETVPTAFRAHTGDWRRALRIYTDWVRSWYRPQVARKDWFQRVFYYQQSTAWGPLRDRATGTWRMADVIGEFRDFFGCLDYLHIFDFGASRVYGRVGDYSHYDELGGLAAMREAIATAQRMGVPIGLYIEGYLCDERGVWGKPNVGKHDLRKKDGTSLLWPGTPTEHMMCAASTAWRRHLAETYQRVAGELEPNGMYIDQYGFVNTWKTCWSREHGHPVPWAPIRGERDTTRAIRASVPPEIATLTEETPNDVNSQVQDGGLGYSTWQADPDLMPHRVDLFRFVVPSFKVFQLVQYHAFVDGEWERLKYPFFNGEGYWLGNPVHAYSDDAAAFLRKAFAILNRYEDAFSSDDVEPLVPTLVPTVYANRFTGPKHTVWTLFNAQFRTVRGACLRVRHRAGRRYSDAFNRQAIRPRIDGDEAILSLELGPRGVGCVVASEGG